MSGRVLFKYGSVSAIAGGSLAVVANLLHPRTLETYTPEVTLSLIAESSIWVVDHLAGLLAMLLAVGGMLAIARSVTGERGTALAHLGAAGALLSTAVFSVLIAVDGIVHKQLAVEWARAPTAEKAIAFRVAQAVESISVALASIWIIVFFGLTFLIYGLAVSFGEGYPKWLGWVAVLAALGSFATGVGWVFVGLTHLTTNILFPLFSLILTVWLIVMGSLLWRKGGSGTRSTALQPNT